MKKISIFLILVMVFSICGCNSLRKKFIRKKKNTKEPPVYIDFKDYPEKPTKEAYTDYYLFVRGWLDELIGALEQNDSFKRKKRAINEAVMNIEQIISFFSEEGREAAYPLYEEMTSIRTEIESRPNMSDINSNDVKRRSESVKRRFEKSFTYSDAEKWMK
ncbi:MAG: hypothetical protein JW867_02605 [Candidatus Omnitrophica bacterium]|nr:hypothetical protein [Candidatus Omnitrophota bacterium]